MTLRVACAVLAAGASRRLGHPKQLLVHRGQPLVALAASCACQSQAAVCAVVTGAHGGAVAAALTNLSVEVLANPDWEEGMASSIRLAVTWAQDRDCNALLLALCDQPKLTARHLDRLIAEHGQRSLPVASYYAQKNAVPALFPASSFAALSGLSGESGASTLLNGGALVVGVPWPDGEFDVDSPEAERRFLANNG